MAVTDRHKQEGIDRMTELTNIYKLNPNLVKYLKEGRLYYSYVVFGLFSCMDIIEYNTEYARVCRMFEEETGAYVYNLTNDFGEYGDVLLTSNQGALLRRG